MATPASGKALRFGALLLTTLAWNAHAGGGQFCEREIRYELIALTDDGEEMSNVASALNERGEITGGGERAFFWDCAGGYRDLSRVDEVRHSPAGTSINDRGQVALEVIEDEFLPPAGYVWNRSSGYRRVATGTPIALNNAGDMLLGHVGGTFTLWTASAGAVDLTQLTGIEFREAFLNHLRQIGGYGSDGTRTAYLTWSARRGIHFADDEPEESFRSWSVALNERGELLGNIGFASATVPFVIGRDGSFNLVLEPVDGEYIDASAFNNRRQIVGFRSNTLAHFIWDPSHGLRDLDALTFGALPTAPGDSTITSAGSINDWGWIAGSAFLAGSTTSRPVLLVPVPVNEPFYRNLGRLSGARLCRALDSLKLRALIQELVCTH